MQLLSDKLIGFYQSLDPPKQLPEGVDILFPQKDSQVIQLVVKFFQKFYGDDHPRRLMLGINPGRYGAGITGVNFTAPKQLKEYCGIDHHFKPSSELSAAFIYELVAAYGGVKKFYADWFIGSVCPLGFVRRPAPSGGGQRTAREGRDNTIPAKEKNLNYYDDRKLLEVMTPFIVDSINKLVALGFKTDHCICIGGEKNFKYLSGLNDKHKWFGEIVPLPHPRVILQYRRKQKDKYIQQYLMAMKHSG